MKRCAYLFHLFIYLAGTFIQSDLLASANPTMERMFTETTANLLQMLGLPIPYITTMARKCYFLFFYFLSALLSNSAVLTSAGTWNCFQHFFTTPFSATPGQSVSAMVALSSCALSYGHLGKCEPAACRSVLNLCKWLLVDWKDLTPQLKQARI